MPTRISTRATLRLKRMDTRLASSASPIHTAAIPRVCSMTVCLRARPSLVAPVPGGDAGHQVHGRRSQPAAVDGDVVFQGIGPVGPEVVLGKPATLGVAVGDQLP